MKTFLLALLLSIALIGCMEKDKSPGKVVTEKPKPDIAAGKAIAQRDCIGCHKLDGGNAAPAIPVLAGQSERYLLTALNEYRNGTRRHAALKNMTGHMSEADMRNVAGYFASLPPVASAWSTEVELTSPYESGKELAKPCEACHGKEGNSTTSGVPNLAGQQPRYLIVAVQEYLDREREKSPMHGLLRRTERSKLENIALYFASQVPAPRPAPPEGNPAAGQPLSAVCGGCHGPSGVSLDAATPSLASQDPVYLVKAIKAYRTVRRRPQMREYVAGLSDKEIENIAAFYATQKSQPAEKGQAFLMDLARKCDRCHNPKTTTSELAIPKLDGQDKDYLVMALRAYRDDRREVSMMHRMSLPYSDSIIDSIAAYYAKKPPK
jgi:cytochrome c553